MNNNDAYRANQSDWWELLAVLSVAYFPLVGFGLYSRVLPPDERTIPYWASTVEASFYTACGCVAVLYILYRSGESWSRFGLGKIKLSDAALGFVVWFFDMAIAAAWEKLEPHWLTLGFGSSKNSPLPNTALDYILMVLDYGVGAFGEELVFRGYLITRLEKLTGSSTKAVLISSALFATCHISYSLSGMVQVFAGGIVLGVMFSVIRRLWPLVFAHMAWNVIWTAAAVAARNSAP